MAMNGPVLAKLATRVDLFFAEGTNLLGGRSKSCRSIRPSLSIGTMMIVRGSAKIGKCNNSRIAP